MNAAEHLIVALDFPERKAALDLVDRLDGSVAWFKVGLELFVAEGKSLVSELQSRGHSIFLDLKYHDIPNTVAGAVRSAADLNVQMVTVHAAGGPAMLTAAAEAATSGTKVLAVTVLTSIDEAQLLATGIARSPAAQVEDLATMAWSCGVHGFVSSPMEVERLRGEFGQQPLLVIPGIRPQGSDAGDQRRLATPAAAMTAGASYLVVGRPITRAADPAAAARAILSEMQSSYSFS